MRLFAHEQYLQVRKELVDYIAQTADRLKLENDTVRLAAGRRSLALCARVASVAAAHLMHAQVHLAAALMDRVRAAVFVQNGPRLLLTGIACLIISTKFTETSQEPEGYCLIPSNTHFLAAMNAPPAVTARILTTYERCILHILSWRIRSATTANFADAFRALGLWKLSSRPPERGRAERAMERSQRGPRRAALRAGQKPAGAPLATEAWRALPGGLVVRRCDRAG